MTQTRIETNEPDKKFIKTAYSSSFEIELDPDDFGKSRQAHNKICNMQLLAQLEHCKEEYQYSKKMSNKDLIIAIKSKLNSSPPNFVWEHCSSAKARLHTNANDRYGVMRLVPRDQHTPSSEFWKIIHSDYRHRGGYFEWAIPFGAPTSIPRRYRNELRGIHYSKIDTLTTTKELALYFKKAVLTNDLNNFMCILNKAESLFSNDEVQKILTKNYGKNDDHPDTLLHIVAANGNVSLLEAILEKTNNSSVLMQTINYKGDTPGHIAAKNNRAQTLRKLVQAGASLIAKNKKELSVKDILSSQRKSSNIAQNQPRSFDNTSDQPVLRSKIIQRDLCFVYEKNRPTSHLVMQPKTASALVESGVKHDVQNIIIHSSHSSSHVAPPHSISAHNESVKNQIVKPIPLNTFTSREQGCTLSAAQESPLIYKKPVQFSAASNNPPVQCVEKNRVIECKTASITNNHAPSPAQKSFSQVKSLTFFSTPSTKAQFSNQTSRLNPQAHRTQNPQVRSVAQVVTRRPAQMNTQKTVSMAVQRTAPVATQAAAQKAALVVAAAQRAALVAAAQKAALVVAAAQRAALVAAAQKAALAAAQKAALAATAQKAAQAAAAQKTALAATAQKAALAATAQKAALAATAQKAALAATAQKAAQAATAQKAAQATTQRAAQAATQRTACAASQSRSRR
ncbi:MAG: hypothetical protein P4M14_10105 [Gammaproteobacteria bacterium]|nr:hypothetical protein [Gammaproteobacteria bacterium]